MRDTIREEARASWHSRSKLGWNLEKRKEKLWNERLPDLHNQELDLKIRAIEVQKQCLADWYNRSYAYNAMAKDFIVNEKPSKWFFSRVKQDSYQRIDLLEDEQGNLQTEPDELLDVATQFYEIPYSEKPSDKRAREEILGCLDIKMTEQVVRMLEASIMVREIEGSLDRAALGKSPGEDVRWPSLWVLQGSL